MKKNTVPFSSPLNEKDTELNTFGCRSNNPDICGNNGLDGVCAFVRDDGMCQKPSRAWKKQYQKLLAEKEASK